MAKRVLSTLSLFFLEGNGQIEIIKAKKTITLFW